MQKQKQTLPNIKKKSAINTFCTELDPTIAQLLPGKAA